MKLSDFIGDSAAGIPEPADDGVTYGRRTLAASSSWQAVATIAEADLNYAPIVHDHDGTYGALGTTNVWTENQLFQGSLGLGGANIDGSYVLNATGSINLSAGSNFFVNGVPISTFIDAPNDGFIYGRQSLGWVQIDAGGGGTVTNLTNVPSTTNVAINNSGGDNTTIPGATVSAAGVLSASDKIKLDGIAADAKADHGNLAGLGDDDHSQYHNNARGDARYPPEAPSDGTIYGRKDGAWVEASEAGGGVTDHGGLTGLGDDDHPQYVRSDANDSKTGYLRFNDNNECQLGTGGDFQMSFSGSHTYFDMILGNLYIRDSSTTRFTFDDNGTFTATGDVEAYSDERLKENIQIIDDPLGRIRQVNGITFNRIDTPVFKRSTGLIAQELERVLPEAVSTDEDGFKSVAYGNVVGLLIEAIKELEDRILELETP